ncbi:hypothetical protein SOVF_184040 [Spinacia oleracea]|uniref:Alanyl-transfer RNA synthetases family profile domain-containing protein n=1 Tax=Spinacia oleracea TaxID=3562 RepID=A0A9R0J6H5_SPIOL|nr:uncharacterized protein LOC110801124 [Spinacia oleracea]KNA06115.1 hypothetical protein SOVF_184040 [Spinacia oleracea]
MDHSTPPTKLEYFDNMSKLHSEATILFHFQGDDGRQALILDSTVFHPQGGGQPSDTGFINDLNSSFKFVVDDVRNKDGIVYHFGNAENLECIDQLMIKRGTKVYLDVDESRRNLNSRLHSAGHVLDISIRNVGLEHFEPGKAYHFPDGPFVEYKGTIPQTELQIKLEQLEKDVNAQISRGQKVFVGLFPYEEAADICGGRLPDYIPKGNSPRIVKIGEHFGCPCGGTHVADISEIRSMKISKIRSKKGVSRVFYNISA